MKVILVNGSPHEKGCTYVGLTEVEKALNENGIETEIFWIGNQAIRGCMACKGCFTKGECVFEDSVVEFTRKAKDADGFVFGTPVHYASAGGAITSFLDRAFYSSKVFAHKPGAVIVSCRRGGASAAFDQLNKYFTISQMPIVSSRYWNMVHGNEPEEVYKDEEGMQTMRVLGRNMAWLLKSIEAGKNSGIEIPEQETPIRTNYIR